MKRLIFTLFALTATTTFANKASLEKMNSKQFCWSAYQRGPQVMRLSDKEISVDYIGTRFILDIETSSEYQIQDQSKKIEVASYDL